MSRFKIPDNLKGVPRHYNVCDTAWANLIERARRKYQREYHYDVIMPGSRNVSRYITEIAFFDFEDTRPQELKDLDLERLKKGLLPYWYWEERAYKHTLSLHMQTEYRLIDLCNEFHINRDNWKGLMVGAQKPNKVAWVLNVIGMGWLMPKQ